MQTLTTTQLARQLEITTKELIVILVDSNFIYMKNEKQFLTAKGKDVGGKMKSSDHGEFILWPQDFDPVTKSEQTRSNEECTKKLFLNSTKIGEKFDVSNQRVNNILAELGWTEKAVKGWQITYQGRNLGGIEMEHMSGAKYVIWPEDILTNSFFLKAFKPVEFSYSRKPSEPLSHSDISKTENKYPEVILKAKDGHLVRSRAELIIDNLLYDYGLLHAYERELTVPETMYSDFYIPARDGRKAVYIEFWGINDNQSYLDRKKHKLEVYKTQQLNLIQLEDKHLDNMDSHLRKEFLKYGINVE